MIRSILKAVIVGWVAKKFLGRGSSPAQRPAPRNGPAPHAD
ncbi:hypothetical protein [Aureimonas mangrovi]|nr:hypothetical protein [Aureimonas mangrovi]